MDEEDASLKLKKDEPFIIICGRTTDNCQKGKLIKFSMANTSLNEFADETGIPIEKVVLKSFSIKQINNEDAESNLRISRDEMYLFPNPAENNIIIRYFISSDEHVEISLYNVLGERISDFINKPELKGFYSIDVSLHSIPLGVYTCVMVTGENKKMVKKLVISK